MAGMALILNAMCMNAMNCEPPNSTIPSNYDVIRNGTVLIESESAKEVMLANLAKELRGKTLRVTTLRDPPLSYTINVNNVTVGKGISFEFLDFLVEKFDFKYEIILPKYNILGSTDDTQGSILEMMSTNQADIAVAFLPILADARKHMLYSTALDEGEWMMIMLRPGESASGAGLLAPFDENVWILILVSLILVGPLIYLILVIRYKFTKDSEQKSYALPHCIWFVYGALMKQGSTLSPTADSIRIIFSTWWIFITILTSFYTANLTAFLTLSKFTLPINNPGDILKKEKPFVSHRGFAIEYAIRNNDEQLTFLLPLVNKKLGDFSSEFNDTEILLNEVQKKNYVFIRDKPAMDHLVYNDYRSRKEFARVNEKLQCPFAVSKEPFIKRKRAFAYPKDTKWNALFDPQLLYLVESGIVKYKLNEGLPKAEICPQDLGSTERQLRLQDLLTTYLTMLTGFSTALVIFFTEMLFRFLNNRKIKNDNVSASNVRKINVKPANSRRDKNITMMADISNGAGFSPPPPYGAIFVNGKAKNFDESNGQMKTINGRNYTVVKDNNGSSQLVPMRTPSAAIFQYAYSNYTYNN
ncbi:unnamed protein product [Diamesa serratosioi]